VYNRQNKSLIVEAFLKYQVFYLSFFLNKNEPVLVQGKLLRLPHKTISTKRSAKLASECNYFTYTEISSFRAVQFL